MEFYQPISEELFGQKYMINGEATPNEVVTAIAQDAASVEKGRKKKEMWSRIFQSMIDKQEFLPGGRIVANARPWLSGKCYNNCYVTPIEDSLDGIYKALRQDSSISGSGGGNGLNISTLRPEGSPIKSGGQSSGALSFLRVFNESAKVIQTGGGRRAAHIAILNVDHPDIEKFIEMKQGSKNNELTQFNISVGITDKFIRAVKDNADWDLQFKGEVYRTVKASDLFNKIMKNAYDYNEPGLFFLDTVNKYNNGYYLHTIVAPNPCGELPLSPFGACDLGAINLSALISKPFTQEASFNFPRFKTLVSHGVRFLDNILDRSSYPLPEIEKEVKSIRKLGLGFTGLGDMLAMLGIVYGSPESIEFVDLIMSVMRDEAYNASIDLAKEKGSFPALNKKKYLEGKFVKKLPSDIRARIKKHGIRNITLLTVAPTGTISFAMGNNCSSGIEPIFSLEYERTVRTGYGDETKKETVYDYAWGLWKEKFPDEQEPPEYFTTSLNIDPIDHIKLQSTIQGYIDNSISKTINLPKKYSFEDYEKLFMMAYDSGLKGFTTFNPYSKAEGAMKGILSHGDEENESCAARHAKKRPRDVEAEIHVHSIKGQKYLVLVGILDKSPYEVFVTEATKELISIEKQLHGSRGVIRKKARGRYDLVQINGTEETIIENIAKTFNPDYEGPTRLLSTSLRHNVPLMFVVEQLGKSSFGSWSKTVSLVLKKYIKDGEAVTGATCSNPECLSSNLAYKEGCVVCLDCGSSTCG